MKFLLLSLVCSFFVFSCEACAPGNVGTTTMTPPSDDTPIGDCTTCDGDLPLLMGPKMRTKYSICGTNDSSNTTCWIPPAKIGKPCVTMSIVCPSSAAIKINSYNYQINKEQIELTCSAGGTHWELQNNENISLPVNSYTCLRYCDSCDVADITSKNGIITLEQGDDMGCKKAKISCPVGTDKIMFGDATPEAYTGEKTLQCSNDGSSWEYMDKKITSFECLKDCKMPSTCPLDEFDTKTGCVDLKIECNHQTGKNELKCIDKEDIKHTLKVKVKKNGQTDILTATCNEKTENWIAEDGDTVIDYECIKNS